MDSEQPQEVQQKEESQKTLERIEKDKGVQSLAVPTAIVLAGALIAGAVYMSNTRNTDSQGGSFPSPVQGKVNVNDVKITKDTPYIGNPAAPVTLAYWADYQCPFCKAFDVGGVPGINVTAALPVLKQKYIDTGKLKIVFKDFAFLGEDSTTAALYKRAVWDLYPDKFFAWHEAMFRAQDEENGGFGNEESILKLIRTVPGLDADKLKARVTSKKDAYLALIKADRDEGASLGVQGTPAFITGTTFIAGAQGPSAFENAIDAQLK